jgi:DNA-damage-inducible protein D
LIRIQQLFKQGGTIAKNARIAFEDKTGKSVVTGENFLPPAKTELDE